MYKVFKPKGYSANVTVENTDSNSSIVIGRASMNVLTCLKEAGYDAPAPQDEWGFEVNKETATALAKLAMPMKKPIRDQRSKESKKDANKKIDAMDVMLGLAHYN